MLRGVGCVTGDRKTVSNQGGGGRCCRCPCAAADVYIVSVDAVFLFLVFIVALVFPVCVGVCVGTDAALVVYTFLAGAVSRLR